MPFETPKLVQIKGRLQLPGTAEIVLLKIGSKAGQRERCGFVMNDGEIIEASNVAERPSREFEVDPEVQLYLVKNRPDDILGVFHTHPSGSSTPSDRDEAGWPYNLSWRYFIVTSSMITEWKRAERDVPAGLARR